MKDQKTCLATPESRPGDCWVNIMSKIKLWL